MDRLQRSSTLLADVPHYVALTKQALQDMGRTEQQYDFFLILFLHSLNCVPAVAVTLSNLFLSASRFVSRRTAMSGRGAGSSSALHCAPLLYTPSMAALPMRRTTSRMLLGQKQRKMLWTSSSQVRMCAGVFVPALICTAVSG